MYHGTQRCRQDDSCPQRNGSAPRIFGRYHSGCKEHFQSENLRTGLASRRDNIPQEVFEYFPVLDEMRHRMGGDLSGGQQQQLSIARALVTRPKLLILDEPTEGIQPNIIQRIGQVLKQLSSEKGMTILIVEQYLDFAKEFCDNFVLMNRGRVVASDQISKLSEGLIEEFLHV